MVPVKVAEATDLKNQLESCAWADYWLLALEDETGKVLKAIGYGKRPTEVDVIEAETELRTYRGLAKVNFSLITVERGQALEALEAAQEQGKTLYYTRK